MPSAPRSALRRLVPLVAALALLSPALAALTATPASAGPTVTRLAGADRYATAVAVSKATHSAGARVAVLTTGANFPDALAGGPAASALGGPVLLVQRDGVPTVVRDELRRLQPERVLVLGGASAVSDTATVQLAQESFTVQRIAGAGRYDTAALVSQEVFAPGAPVVYVATGADYPDALAGAAAAGAAKAPVLLVARDGVPSATATELTRLQPSRIVVLGGTGAVSAAAEQALAAYAPTVTRIAGADRYATAAAVARATPGTPRGIFLANGTGFADALTGGPAAAAGGAPVLLVPGTCIPGPVHNEMERHGFPPVTLLGGSAALGLGVQELRPCFRAPDGQLADGVTLSTIDDPRGPWRGKVVAVEPRAVWRLDTVLAQDTLPGLETTASIARRTAAVVAVNGDFALAGGRPVHAFAKDGRLLQTPQALGRNFAVQARSGTPHLGFPEVDMTLDVPEAAATATVSRINSGPSTGSALALTTPEGGVDAPASSCAATLVRSGVPALRADGRAVQAYDVRAATCDGGTRAPGLDVLTTPNDGALAPLVRSLDVGERVSLSWTVGWPDVLDTLGGNPTLLEKGAVIAGNVDGTDAFSQRNPRTAVGYRPDGTVLLVTVDGRGAGGSVGMTLRELAQLFVRLGASDALNLDGGGSTTMVVGGEVQNVPSDGPDRPVSSALVLVPGTRPGSGALRTQSDPAAAPTRLSPEEQADAERRIATDPGSTGGLVGRD